jgi:AraC-like DNA-binding protein
MASRSLQSALDFDAEWHRAADVAGSSTPLSRNIVRTVYSGPGGSGTADTVKLGDDGLVNVVNCTLPQAVRWDYVTDEPTLMLRASLACDVEIRFGSEPAMVFDRPELTLAAFPTGLGMTANVAAGARQQGVVAVFRSASLATRFGLLDDDLPAEVQAALADGATIGRIASFPVDHRVAALIADTLDSRLQGELRTLQVAGRVAELLACALDALASQGRRRSAPLHRRRDLDVAHAAKARLDQDYRRPPLFATLSQELGTSQNRLKAVFKTSFGVTMAEYCLELRVREAQQLLMEAALTIAQVAERVGYEHQSSFTAAFRGVVGMSPRDYRKQRAPFSVPLVPQGAPRPAGGRARG